MLSATSQLWETIGSGSFVNNSRSSMLSLSMIEQKINVLRSIPGNKYKRASIKEE
jgi:hypothetical protein